MKRILLPLLLLSVISSSAQVIHIPTVVHILWNDSSDNIPDQQIQEVIELVNADWRRQNADTNLTPDHFLPVAADMEIEFHLATVDPSGNPTNGITRTHTDSIEFEPLLEHMKYDSTGGKTAWDTDHHLNIWAMESIVNHSIGGTTLGASSFPDVSPFEIPGAIFRIDLFTTDLHRWRAITHELGHFFCLHHTFSDSCYNHDSIDDTPFALNTTMIPDSCGSIISSCVDNLPNGDMYMNFMHYSAPNCMNIFTQGQKSWARNCFYEHYPGFINSPGLGIKGKTRTPLTLHPNPTTSQINFALPNSGLFEILDLSGRTLESGAVYKGENTLSLDLLNPGVHLLKITDNEGVSTARFIKQ